MRPKAGSDIGVEMIGVAVPFDYLSIRSGASQRIKSDLTALVSEGKNVEVICPTRQNVAMNKQSDICDINVITYRNIQGFLTLPEKIRLLFDMHTQPLNPFFWNAMRKSANSYSIIFAHYPWCAVASYRAVGKTVPLVLVDHDFQYGLIKQATRNPLIHAYIHFLEKYACKKAARILCVSDQDAVGLQEEYNVPTEKLIILPNTVDTEYFSKARDLFDNVLERNKLGLDPMSFIVLFYGGMDSRANVDALKFVLDQLVPELSRINVNAKVMVVGAQMPEWCLNNPSVLCYANVPDIRRFLSVADVVIIPLTIGGGSRIRILESFSAKVSVISTLKGAEGIDYDDGTQLLIAERTAEDFISKIKILSEDNSLSEKLVGNAYELVEGKYSLKVAGKCLGQIVEQLEYPAKSGRVA